MKTFLVWETEYAEEGSTEIEAMTEKGALRAYRRQTQERCSGPHNLTDLSYCEATPEILALRRRRAEAWT